MNVIILALLIFVHTVLSINLMGRIVPTPPKYKTRLVIISAFNAIIGTLAFVSVETYAWQGYLITMLIFFVEMALLFRSYYLTIVTAVAGVYLHAFTFRYVTLAILTLINDTSPFSILNDSESFFMYTVMVLSIHIPILALFSYGIPPRFLKAIIENNNMLGVLAIVTVAATGYSIYNSVIASVDINIYDIKIQQIVLPLFLLSIFYAALFMTIMIVSFQRYKAKSKELEDRISEDKKLQKALFNLADIYIDINCTRDTINRLIVAGEEYETDKLPSYSQFLLANAAQFVYYEDIPTATRYSTSRIIKECLAGKKQLIYDYRTMAFNAPTNDTYVNDNPSQYIWYRMMINITKNEETGEINAICTADDIQSEKEEEIALRHKAERDPLTGAYNKEGIKNNVEKYLKSGGHGTMFMFDLDNFKGINDNMGHVFGDKVLNEIYVEVDKLFRSQDFIARVGGDEFVVFMVGNESSELITSKANAICESLNRKYVADNGVSINISTSVGIAITPKDSTEYDTLYHLSDLAMYASKNGGKNMYTIYNKDMHNTYSPHREEDYQRRNTQVPKI